MRQWISELRENKLLIVPKLFAILHGSFGVIFLLVFFVAVAAPFVGSVPFTIDTSGVSGAVVIIAIYVGITFILFSLAKGFGQHDKVSAWVCDISSQRACYWPNK
jgi:hypothetical protein